MLQRILPCLLIFVAALPSAARANKISGLFQKVKHSVVVIETEQQEVDPLIPGQLMAVEGVGSGFLIDDDKVMTASHVVQVADRIRVRFQDGETIPAKVLSSEPWADVALLQLKRLPKQAGKVVLGDSDKTRVGDEIFIVGAPLGMSYTLTVGHISALRSEEGVFGGSSVTDMLQTDAAINRGNSGGPMFNMKGEAIGVVSHMISQSGGYEGLGFVIASNMAKELLLERRTLWSGVQGRWLEAPIAALLNVPQHRALLVEKVAAHSPATHLGLKPGIVGAIILDEQFILGGDIVLELQGISLADEDYFEKAREAAENLKDGDEIVVRVLRGGKVMDLKNYYFPDLLLPGPAKRAED